MIHEAEHHGDHTRVVQLSHRYGMILFIASEVMFFVAWFWAYFNTALFPADVHQVVRTDLIGGVWPPKGIETFDPWHLPLLNTLILLTSGTTVTWAHHALLEGDREGVKQGLWLTIVLGALFTCVQAYEYSHAAFSFKGNIYGATFFMATGFHGAHVLIGTIFLIVCLVRVYAGHFNPKQHLGFEFAAWYWHFVDVVWIFLFACIYVWGYGGPVAGGGSALARSIIDTKRAAAAALFFCAVSCHRPRGVISCQASRRSSRASRDSGSSLRRGIARVHGEPA